MGCRGRLLTSSLKPARSLSAPRALALTAGMWQLLPPAVLLLLGKSVAAEGDPQDALGPAQTGPSSRQQAALDLAHRTNRSQARDREDAGSFGPIRR